MYSNIKEHGRYCVARYMVVICKGNPVVPVKFKEMLRLPYKLREIIFSNSILLFPMGRESSRVERRRMEI